MSYELKIVKEVEHYASVEVISIQTHYLGLFSRAWNIYTETCYPDSLILAGDEDGGLVILLTADSEHRDQATLGPYGGWRNPTGNHRKDVEFDSTVLRLNTPWLFRLFEDSWQYETTTSGKDSVTVVLYFRTGDLFHRFNRRLNNFAMAPFVAVTDFFSKRRTQKLLSRL